MADNPEANETGQEELDYLKQYHETNAAEQAEQTARDARQLDAQEYSQSAPQEGQAEQPFGGRKDDNALVAGRTGAAADQAEENAELNLGQLTGDVENAVAASEIESDPQSQTVENEPLQGVASTPESGLDGMAADSTDTSPERGDVRAADLTADALENPQNPEIPVQTSTAQVTSAEAVLPDETDAVLAGEDTAEDETPPPPVAQTPSIIATAATGDEDTDIALNINVASLDSDGGKESLSITISGVPEGVTLSAGTDLGNGNWQLYLADLNGLTLSTPENYSGNFNLTITATATEANGNTATTTSSMPVSATAVADAPELKATLGDTHEDRSADLTITGALIDTDGSEALTYEISNLPEGSSLTAGARNADGTWTLLPEDLDGLQFNPPSNYSGEITFDVAAIATDNDGSAARTETVLEANVTPVADTPDQSANNISGQEDTPTSIEVSSELTDSSESLSVQISNVPNGASLSHGIDLGNGVWSVDPADLGNLTVTPPADFSGSFDFEITSTATESDGSTASTSDTFTVSVSGVADAPELDVQNATGAEDNTSIPLDISSALTDLDSSETLSITVSNMPEGFTLNAGTNNGDGSWTLAPSNLAGLTITAPKDYSGEFNLSVSATSTEADGDTHTTSTTLPVSITGIADSPEVKAVDVSGTEDSSIALDLSAVTMDIDGSETITSTVITGVPEEFTISAGIDLGNGEWSIPVNQLADVSLTAPEHYSGTVSLGLTATAEDTGGDTATTSTNFSATFSAVADAPTVGAADVSGSEDSPIALTLGSSLVDTDGSETLGVVISGLPEGSTLSSGNALGNGEWAVPVADLADLTITPPRDFSGEMSLEITATSTEPDGSSAVSSAPFTVTVDAVADAPELTASLSGAEEDNGMAINVAGTLTDADGSENISYTISDVPDGFSLSDGILNNDGSWSLSPDQLNNLELIPPQDFSGNVSLTVTATSTDENGDTSNTTVNVDGIFAAVADAPIAAADNVSGNEDNPITLNLTAAVVDVDGSETLSTVITGVPAGASLSSGNDLGNGRWFVEPADLGNLTVTPPEHFSGTMNLALESTATDTGGVTDVTTAPFSVAVAPVIDSPTLGTETSRGNEDTSIAIDVDALLVDTDGSETLSLKIEGVPDGFNLSSGTKNADGTWNLEPDDINGLTMNTPQDYKGEFNITVTATSTESDGQTASVKSVIPVTVDAVADTPDLQVTAASTAEDTAVALDISSATTDITGTESITQLVISGVPEDASLSAGTLNGDGSWTLEPGQLQGLTLNPPADSNEDFTLTVTTTAVEPNGSTASNTTTLPVSSSGVADTPTISTEDANGTEDRFISLDIEGGVTDLDGSESIHFQISDLPNGATLNHGIRQSDGTWKVEADDIDSLAIKAPRNFSGKFDINVTSVATENDGDTARTSSPITVSVEADADRAWVRVRSVSGMEDEPLNLNLNTRVVDSSEEIQSTVITGVPEGFTVNGGADLGNGEWSVPADDLGSISLSAPEDYSGTVRLGFKVTTVEPENGDTATRTNGFRATFNADADAPAVTAQDVATNEDTPVQLALGAQLTDIDGSESLGITISGVPDGATLSSGTNNGDGIWTVDPGDFDSLELTPPENFSGPINLSMLATSTESSNNDTAISSVDFSVDVIGVADVPSLTVVDALGNEDSGIGLTIRAGLADTDGSESLYVEFSDVPNGSSFSAGTPLANGNWVVPSSALDTLEITPPMDSNESFTLTVRSLAVEEDGSRTYSEPQNLDVTVRGVPDVPEMEIGVAQGNEDTPISLNFNATSTDDDSSETISYVISDLPQGASLSTGVFIGNGRWSVSQEDMQNLTVNPPKDFAGEFNLNIKVVVQENDGRQASHDYTTTVNVDAVVDQPARGGLDAPRSYGSATGTEDTAISLNLDPGLRDSDDSESVEWVEVSDIPDGAILSVNGIALTAADEQEPSVFRIMPDDLNNVTVTPPDDSGDDFQLSIKAMITDGEGVNATSEGLLNVRVIADADTPTLSADSISGDSGDEISAEISSALTDVDGSESLNFIISGLEGTQIVPTDGLNIGGGSFLVSDEQLANLSFVHKGDDTSMIVPVTVHAIATESEGDTATSTISFDLAINEDGGGGSWWDNLVDWIRDQLGIGSNDDDNADPSEAPELSVTPPEGTEDQAFAITAIPDFGERGSQESIVIRDLPDGATPNMGFYNPIDGNWIIPGDDPNIANLAINPPADFAGSFEFTMTAVKTGNDGETQQDVENVTADIDPVVDHPGVRLGNSSGTEDTPLNLDLRVTTGDSDGSESLVLVIISDVPEGASINGAIDLGDGRFSVDPTALDQLSFVPPENEHGNYKLTVETVIEESNGSQTSFSNTLGVKITAETDSADLTVNDTTGTEDTAVPLNIDADFMDEDGSEVMSVTISGVPDDAMFSTGSNNGDGSWTFTAAQLENLTFTPPPDASGTFDMTLNAYTMETSTGEVTTTSSNFSVDVEGTADAVIVDSQNSHGDEDTAIPVTIEYTEFDIDGSESVVAVLTGMPEGTTFSHGSLQEDGSWEVTGAELTNLTVTPPEHFSGDINFHAKIITTDGSDSASSATDLTVSVAPIADAAVVEPQEAVGIEDTDIPLDLGVSLTDGSEILEVTVTGVPVGATLDAGTQNADGSWTLAADDLDGLTMTPAQNQSGEFILTVTATSTEPETGETATSSSTMTLDIVGVADAVTVNATDAAGKEDTAITINADFSYQDVDGSETVTAITVSGVPEGATLSVGTQNMDGTWTVDPSDLEGMTFTPSENFSGEVNLSLGFVNEEADGDTLVTTQDITVNVAGEADEVIVNATDSIGSEDTAIAIDVDFSYQDMDGSEIVTAIIVSGVPEGATLSVGTQNMDGTWTVDPSDLEGMTFTPSENFSGEVNLSLGFVNEEADGDTLVTTQDITVSVAGEADEVIVNATDSIGSEDTAIAIDADFSYQDMDGSEIVTVITVSGVPEGGTLSVGTQNLDGTWTVDSSDLEVMAFTPPENFSGEVNLSLGFVNAEADGDTLITTQDIAISVAGEADEVIVNATDSIGNEDAAIAIDANFSYQDMDGSENVTVITVSGVPEGGTLSVGTQNLDGTWTVDPSDLEVMTFTPPENFSGEVNLSLGFVNVEADGDTLVTTQDIAVTISVEGDPDGPLLSTEDVSGTQGEPIYLNMQAEAVAENKTLSLTILDLPEGSVLSAGLKNEDGSWSLEPEEIEGLQLNTPEDFSGDFSLNVTTTVKDEGNTFETFHSISVSVEASPEPFIPMSTGSHAYMDEIEINDDGNKNPNNISHQAQYYADQLGLQSTFKPEENAQPDAQELEQTLSGVPNGTSVDTLINNHIENQSEALAGEQILEDPIPAVQENIMEQGNENAYLIILENEMG